MDLLTMVRQDTGAPFRKAATTNGGEYTGPCPLCKEGDDRFHIWDKHPSGKARWWCRMCGQSGDTIQYLRDVRGMSYRDACRALNIDPGDTRTPTRAKVQHRVPQVQPLSGMWQGRSWDLVRYARDLLWSKVGYPARQYLIYERGLIEQTIRHFLLGYYPLGKFKFNHDKDIEQWGPEVKDERWVTLPPGIVIPCQTDGALWYVKVRCPHQDKHTGSLDTLSAYLWYAWSWQKDGETVYSQAKYVNVTGSEGIALFGADDLRGDGASFVTLTKHGQLRGCIGSLEPRRSLAVDVRENAVAAALQDPRFPPVRREELGDLHIEVSVLSIPQRLEYDGVDDLIAKLRPGIDGVVIERGWNRATFLPQVWEKVPSAHQFLQHLCLKAYLPVDAYRDADLDVYTYQVEEFEE